MTSIRISHLQFPVTAIGPGRRLVVWVQGCSLACPGCMSRDTWDPAAGREVSLDEIGERWQRALRAGADGLTISGGEPLEQSGPLAELLSMAGYDRRDLNPGADLMFYTGYTESAARRRSARAFALADAVITGRYVQSRPTGLIWRGSANQRLVPLTEIGWSKYRQYLDHTPERPPIQVTVDGDSVRLIGVPRSGDLTRLDEGLAGIGLAVGAATWKR